jgi:hypothetical protein
LIKCKNFGAQLLGNALSFSIIINGVMEIKLANNSLWVDVCGWVIPYFAGA